MGFVNAFRIGFRVLVSLIPSPELGWRASDPESLKLQVPSNAAGMDPYN